MFNIDRITVSIYVKRHQGSESEMEPTCSQTEIRKEKCKAQAYETFNNDDKMAKVRKKKQYSSKPDNKHEVDDKSSRFNEMSLTIMRERKRRRVQYLRHDEEMMRVR